MNTVDTVKCPACGKEMKSLSGHITHKHGPVAEFDRLYPDCVKVAPSVLAKQVQGRKSAFDVKTPAEKAAFRQKMSGVMKACLSTLTDEDRKQWGSRSSASMKKYMESLSEEDRAAYVKRASDKAKKQDLSKFTQAGRAGFRKWQASMSKEEKAAYAAKLSEAQKGRYARMTEEELNEHIRKTTGRDSSKVEAAVVACLLEAGLQVETKKKFGRSEVDAFLPATNTVVEVYGDYWHGGEKFFDADDIHPTTGMKIADIRSRDDERVARIRAFGVDVIIVWESDVKNDIAQALHHIIHGNTERSRGGNSAERVETEARAYAETTLLGGNGSPTSSNAGGRVRESSLTGR